MGGGSKGIKSSGRGQLTHVGNQGQLRFNEGACSDKVSETGFEYVWFDTVPNPVVPSGILNTSAANGIGTSVVYVPAYRPIMFVNLSGGDAFVSFGVSNRASTNIVTGVENVTVTVSGRLATFTSDTNWAVLPKVGEFLIVDAGSAFNAANQGTFRIHAVTENSVTALINGAAAEGPIAIGAAADLRVVGMFCDALTGFLIQDGVRMVLSTGGSNYVLASANGVFAYLANDSDVTVNVTKEL